MSSCQRRRGRSTRKKPGRFLRSNRRRRWIRLCSRTTLSTRLGLTATPSRRRTNAQTHPHPVPVGLIVERLLDNHPLDWIADRAPPGHRSRLRRPIQRLPTHPQHARHTRQRIPLGDQTARPGDTHAHSQPANAFPAISSSYVLGPSARSSSATFRRNSRSPWRSCFPASCLRAAALKQLLPPRVKERLGDLVLPADVPGAAIAAQGGQHDLDLLLRRPAPILPLLAQPIFSSGRATDAEPDAGQSLRRYAPPGPSDHPTQLAVNTPTGSRARASASTGSASGSSTRSSASHRSRRPPSSTRPSSRVPRHRQRSPRVQPRSPPRTSTRWWVARRSGSSCSRRTQTSDRPAGCSSSPGGWESA